MKGTDVNYVKNIGLASVGMLALSFGSSSVSAAEFFDFEFISTIASTGTQTGSFSGQFTVDGGLIVGITGSGAELGTITSLFAPGTVAVNSNFPPNDNVFSPTDPFLSFDGVSFASTNFAALNLFRNGAGNYFVLSGAPNVVTGITEGRLSVISSAVPEPATWAMLLLGFGFVGGAMRTAKRRHKVTVTYA